MKTAILGAIVAACLLFAVAAAADSEGQRPTLAGIQGVTVGIEPINDPQVERDGLSMSAIQTDLELKLRRAGIPVLTSDQAKPRFPHILFLLLTIGVLKDPDLPAYTYGIQLQLFQSVTLGEGTGHKRSGHDLERDDKDRVRRN